MLFWLVSSLIILIILANLMLASYTAGLHIGYTRGMYDAMQAATNLECALVDALRAAYDDLGIDNPDRVLFDKDDINRALYYDGANEYRGKP